MTSATRRRERGATGPEYAGAIAIAALVVTVLFGVIYSANLGSHVSSLICRIFAMDCGSEELSMDELLPSCEVMSTSLNARAEVTVFSVNLGAGGEAIVTEIRNPDGSTTWEVTLHVEGHVGAHFMAGVKALGEGGSAELKAALAAAGGSTFEFSSEQEAMQFLEAVAIETAKTVVSGGNPVVKWLVDKVTELFIDPYQFPEPSSYYFQAGPQVSGSIEASAGLSVGAELELSGALGYKVDQSVDPPVYTYYVETTSDLAIELGVAELGGETETMVALSYQNGQPVSAQITVSGQINGGWFGSGEGTDIPIGKYGDLTPGMDSSVVVTGTGVVNLTLDLTNPANRNALADTFGSVGVPLLGDYRSDHYVNPVDAVTTLADRFREGPRAGATITAQTFVGDTMELGFEAYGGKGLTFGGGIGFGSSHMQSSGAWYYEPGVGMTQWERCL